jgi:dihydrofolate reductase
MIISLIVGMSADRVIGRANQLPWHLPRDLRWFRRCTLGKPVIMGSKTWESIGRPLSQRTNIVLTSRDAPQNVLVARSLDEALSLAQGSLGATGEVMVIGGATVYAAFLPLADRLYITRIEASIEGDTFFPEWTSADWHEADRQSYPADSHNPYPITL